MKLRFLKAVSVFSLTALMMMTLTMPEAFARKNNYYYGYDSPYYNNYNPPGTAVGRYFNRHPIVKKAAIGVGTGAVIGGILGGDNWQRTAVKGALIGGLAGTAWGYAQNRGYLNGGRPVPQSYNARYYRPQKVFYTASGRPYYRYYPQ